MSRNPYATNLTSINVGDHNYSATLINQATQQAKPKTTLKHLRNYEIEKEFREKLGRDAEEIGWKN